MADKILITGGAGFIGCNTADYYLKQGKNVVIVDNWSRVGTEKNIQWLMENYRGSGKLHFYDIDIRNFKDLEDVIKKELPDAIFHLAAQVAVTTSVEDPRSDFEINLLGAFNLLESVRINLGKQVPVIYSSTNKVYGEIGSEVTEEETRYRYSDAILNEFGVNEDHPIDLHSPYGCSKGGADQYFRDYYRIYNLPTIVFRQSCIYGERQFGNEDQGWVMFFALVAAKGGKLNIFGDGKQVRDILFVSDLVKLYDSTINKIESAKGKIYNAGGGPLNTISLLELMSKLEEKIGHSIERDFFDWRAGDQRVYVSDTTKARLDLGWTPKVDVETGIELQLEWARKLAKLSE